MESDGLQSLRLQRVEQDLATEQQQLLTRAPRQFKQEKIIIVLGRTFQSDLLMVRQKGDFPLQQETNKAKSGVRVG